MNGLFVVMSKNIYISSIQFQSKSLIIENAGWSMMGGGPGHSLGQVDLQGPDQGHHHRMEPGPGMWQPGQVQQHHGFDQQSLQHQQHMQQLQQQQQQPHMLMGHQSMGQLVSPGQPLSQMSSVFPASGHGQPQSGSVMMFPGPVHSVQSPPAMIMGGGHHQRPGESGQLGQSASLSPNSTPGLQMPAPAATPPIMNINVEDRNMFLNGMGRLVAPGHGMEKINLEGGGQMSEAEQAMIWKGMQGGILAEMFPAVDRFGGLMPSSSPGQGFATTSAAAAVAAQIQAQENLLRLQQQQQQHGGGQGHKHMAQQPLGFHPGPPAQIMSQVICLKYFSKNSFLYFLARHGQDVSGLTRVCPRPGPGSVPGSPAPASGW